MGGRWSVKKEHPLFCHRRTALTRVITTSAVQDFRAPSGGVGPNMLKPLESFSKPRVFDNACPA